MLKGNQDILSNQIRQIFNFINLTFAETNTNRLFLHSLQRDIIQDNIIVHHLSKEFKALIIDRNIFIITFQLRSHIATLCNGINSLKIYILSITSQILVIHSQKLTPAPLNPLDLMSLLTKLETKLVSHPRLTLPTWHNENIWYMYKFMKLQSFMLSDTLLCSLPHSSS